MTPDCDLTAIKARRDRIQNLIDNTDFLPNLNDAIAACADRAALLKHIDATDRNAVIDKLWLKAYALTLGERSRPRNQGIAHGALLMLNAIEQAGGMNPAERKSSPVATEMGREEKEGASK